MYKFNDFKSKYSVLFFIGLFFLLTNSLFSEGAFYTSISYSPGLTDYFMTDPDPQTHTVKHVALGFELNTSYVFENDFGFGVDFHWGLVHKMTIVNDDARIVIDDWAGNLSQINISPYFLYTPLNNEKSLLGVGIGISHTMYTFSSEYGSDTYEFYWGITLNIQYKYYVSEFLFLNAGFRFTFDFIGLWDAALISNVFQTHYYPAVGFGFTI